MIKKLLTTICKPNLILFIFCLGFSTYIQAQDLETFIDQSLQETDFSKRIPTIDSLKALAIANSPLLKRHDADIEYYNVNISLARKRWMDFIYMESTYSYGIYDYLNSEQLAGLATTDQALINTKATRYTVGLSLKVPISAIFARKKNIEAEKALHTRAKYEKEAKIREIERVLILDYNDLLKAHRLLFISGRVVETYKVQSLRAEIDYKNGLISLSEYTRLQQQLNVAAKELERQKADFLLAFMYLENTIGTNLNVTW